jgi:hypothetical protein
MSMTEKALETLLAREEIRALVQLYARGIDRKDIGLLRTLYTKDGTHSHRAHFSGAAEVYMEQLEKNLPQSTSRAAHYICNHLISIDGEQGEGEVYALAWHMFEDGKGGFAEDLVGVRYVDRYRKEDGDWRFASRDVAIEFRVQHPIAAPDGLPPAPADDATYKILVSGLFARGARRS